MSILGVTHATPAFALPEGACDCHVHVFGPVESYPFARSRVFTPGPASVEELIALQRTLGLQRVVVVQASPYGTDNRCALDALRRLGGQARGVAVIDASVSETALKEMHEAGVPRRPEVIEPFRSEDDGAVLNRLRSWTSGTEQLRKILCENPARLYGFCV